VSYCAPSQTSTKRAITADSYLLAWLSRTAKQRLYRCDQIRAWVRLRGAIMRRLANGRELHEVAATASGS
jgi:hypothetical protein